MHGGTTLIEQRIKRSFDAQTVAIRSVRQFVRDHAETIVGDDDKLADIDLAVSELASNAVQHGCGSSFDVAITISRNSLAVEVTSHHDGHSVCHPSTWNTQQPGAMSGRGLNLVRTVCDTVYIVTDDHEMTVGCRVDVESDSQ